LPLKIIKIIMKVGWGKWGINEIMENGTKEKREWECEKSFLLI